MDREIIYVPEKKVSSRLTEFKKEVKDIWDIAGVPILITLTLVTIFMITHW